MPVPTREKEASTGKISGAIKHRTGVEEYTGAWKPNPGKQERFVYNPELEVLYGGAAGGGKSDGLLMAATLDANRRMHRGLVLRRTYQELRDLVRRSKDLYPRLGGRYRESTREWFFPSGAIIEFGYLKKYDDVMIYQGRQFSFIGWDELTQWPDDKAYVYLLTRLRAPMGAGVRLRCRATTNPGGPGHHWVKTRWNIPNDGASSKIYDADRDSWRVFIPARVTDNPYLAGTDYEKQLDSMPEHLRKTLKEGRWDCLEGVMFTEFDPRIHVCDPFMIGHNKEIWRGCDDGYNAPACVLWFAKIDLRTFVIGELYRPSMTAQTMAEEILKRDRAIPIAFDEKQNLLKNTVPLLGSIDSSAFNESGTGPSSGTGRAQIMNALGCKWRPVSKMERSREAGCHLVHQMLQERLPDGKPKLMFFRNCANLIRTLPALPIDPLNPEDVDTTAEDHAYDALRYGLQHRVTTIVQARLGGM